MKDKEFRMSAKTLILPLFLILLCCVFGCRNKHHTEKNETAHDLPQIKDSGELVVLTLYSLLHISFIADRKWDSNTNSVNSSLKVWD